MNLTCPHCTQLLELTPEVFSELQGQPDFPCPECGGAVPLPEAAPASEPVETVLEKPPVETAEDAGDPAKTSAAKITRRKVAMELFQQANRRVLLLGVAGMLVLGGVAGYLIHEFSGNRTDLNQDITNEILKNKFFTDLIASGATTLAELRKVERIEAHGPGFIGLSREELTWEQALELARTTAGRVLAVETPSENRAPWSSPVMHRLVNFLEQRFPAAQGRTVWVMQNSDASLPHVFHAPDVSPVTTRQRPRRVFLHWMQLPQPPEKGANTSALRFEGKQSVVVEDHADFHDIEAKDELSIEAWLKVSAYDRNFFPILDKPGGLSGYGWYFEIAAGNGFMEFISGSGSAVRFPWKAPLETWTHVAFCYRRGEGRARFYVNGLLEGELDFAGDVQTTNNRALEIGAGPSGQMEHAIGCLDEVRLWKRALSADEVKERFNQRLEGSEDGLVGCWSFDEGAGISTQELTGRQKTTLAPTEAPPRWESSAPFLAAANP